MAVQMLLKKYQVPESSQFEYLMRKYLSSKPEELINPVKTPKKTTPDCLYPDEQYAADLLKALEKLKSIMPRRFYTDIEDVLKKCAEDFSECEESMAKIHGCMKEDIQKSFQRVKPSDIPALQAFILHAGYREIHVHPGDPMKGNEMAWEDTFSEITDDPNKVGCIKEVHTQPYQITFGYDDEQETYILGGACTFFKKEMN